ncbi:MAG: lysylphosphatidylglycerol synthase transmembrane domain-containing protein [Kiritimatiellia bacterium]
MRTLAKNAWPIGRLVVAALLMGWIFLRLWKEPQGLDFRAWHPHWPLLLAAGHILLLGAFLLGITRWRILMHSHHIGLSWRRCFTLFFIGQFFNAFLLGSTGGDMVKAYYAARESHHRKTEAATLVFLDRLIGLSALLFLALGVMTWRIRFVQTQPSLDKAALLMLALLLLLAGGLALLWSRNWLERPFWKRWTSGRLAPITAHVERIYGAVYHFKSQPRVLAQSFALSMGVHGLSLLSCFVFACALRSGLSLFQAFIFFPLIGALGALPLTPGGLGVREGGAVLLFGAIGIPPATAFLLSLLPYVSGLLWSLFGGLLYLTQSEKARLP